MLKRIKTENPNDYFIDLSKRKDRGVYFCRINGYNENIHEFIKKYYEAARLSGVIIEGKLANPDIKNLSYYEEIMGMDFKLDKSFILTSLKKWMPRMNDAPRENVKEAIYSTLDSLRKAGKNENMLKNAYIKFMCWLYYKFERIANHLGEEKLPKILYEGSISSYELLFMDVLCSAGCDIVLLQYKTESEYLKLDPNSEKSFNMKINPSEDFPNDFNLKKIRDDIEQELNKQRLYGTMPKVTNITNSWLREAIIQRAFFTDVEKSVLLRGSDNRFFYNCFLRINGVNDKVTYENELYKNLLEIKSMKRQVIIVNNTISPPSTDEISGIRRKNYQNINQMITDLLSNINFSCNIELKRLFNKAFVDVMLEEGAAEDENINRLVNKAVYILCWLKRYYSDLFGSWEIRSEMPCFFHMGGCKNINEALFLKFLAKLPVDVLIFKPNLNENCCLKDNRLFDINFEESLVLNEYPELNKGTRVTTAAYQAERDLDTIMYQDSGIYRNQQYTKANTITLRTMYEEIGILWNEELKYRPNFSTVDDIVNMPVIFSKVSGVKDGVIPVYWSSIKELITEDTVIIKKIPNITSVSQNTIKPFATEFYRNGRLQKGKIRQHREYKYGFLREPMQEYLLDKLQLLIEQKIIKGTFETGVEYTIISTVLNLDKEILRMIQKFDFTKKNPKLIYIITGETILSLEDSIYAAFLNLVGFDIVFFVPTGYQCVEKFFNGNIIEEHQIGEYVYDLQVPSFDKIIPVKSHTTWRDRIFKRGV